MFSLLLFAFLLIAELSAVLLAEIPDVEFNSTTECRKSLTDDINMTISCTLPSNHHASFLINGLSLNQMVIKEMSTNYVCHSGSCTNTTTTTTILTGQFSSSAIQSCSYTVTCFASGFVKAKSFILKDCTLLPTPLCDTHNDVVNVTYYNNVTIVSSVPVTNIIIETTTIVSSVPVVEPTTVVSPVTVTVTNVIPTSIFETETLNCSKTTTTSIATSTKAATSTSYCAYTSTETFTSTELFCLPSSSSSPSITVTPDAPVVNASAVGAGASAAGLVIVALLIVVFFLVILQCRKGGNGPKNITVSVQNPGYIGRPDEPGKSSTIKSVDVQNASSNHHVIDHTLPNDEPRLPSSSSDS